VNHFEKQANELLDQLGITALPINPVAVCDQLGIEYRESRFDGFEGKLIVTDKHSLIAVNSRIQNSGRKSFTASHELGHFCCHVTLGSRSFNCSRNDLTGASQKKLEIEANQFAAEFMMPSGLSDHLIERHMCDWELINQFASVCDVSLEAAANRYVSKTSLPCAFVISENQRIKYFTSSPELIYRINMDSRSVGKSTAAFHSHIGKNYSDDFQEVPADEWFVGRFTPDSRILEWSLPKNSYGHVYTLLLDEGDICYAKDSPGFTNKRFLDGYEDCSGLVGVDRYMREVNPFRKSKRRP